MATITSPPLIKGNTARFKATVKDFDGEVINPDLVRVRILTPRYEIFDDNIIVSLKNGEYIAYYVPTEVGKFVLEWYCEYGGYPSLIHETIVVQA